MGRGESNDLNLMFPIVLHLEELNSYLKMSIFNVLFLVAANTWVQTLREKGTADFGSFFGGGQMGPDPKSDIRCPLIYRKRLL